MQIFKSTLFKEHFEATVSMFLHIFHKKTVSASPILDSLNRNWHCTKQEVFLYGFLQQIWRIPQETTDLVTFAKEILNRKLIFFVQCEQSGRHQPRYVFSALVIVYDDTFSQKFFIIHRLPLIACPMPIRFAKTLKPGLSLSVHISSCKIKNYICKFPVK